MKQCVAPVSNRMVMRRGPASVARKPDKRGLNVGFSRRHVGNSGVAVKVASCAWNAAANASIEAYTLSTAWASSQAASGNRGSGPWSCLTGAEYRGRRGVPRDDVQAAQPRGSTLVSTGGRKAGGGSHSFAAGCGSGISGGGISAPRSSEAVEVASDALGPARTGPVSWGSRILWGRARVCMPAADRSRPAPPPPHTALGLVCR